MVSRVSIKAYPGAHLFSYLRTLILAVGIFCSFACPPAFAQLNGETTAVDPEPLIETNPSRTTDEQIQARLTGIFAEISGLSEVQVTVREGVVILSGEVANDSLALKAESLAIRIEGVVTTVDEMERFRAIATNVSPILKDIQNILHETVRSLPLLALSFVVFAVTALFFHLLASWSFFWRRVLPNPFLAELLSGAIRVGGIFIGLITALNFMGATALIGAILGGAGVLGIAIGFAVRDGLENYISSVMLSIRQPFRANEHVVIDGHEGKVIRLTSRATVLMTMDGNHLRIPNATVFKAVILNYSRHPERRFDFELGVDAEDDPLAAISVGIEVLEGLNFVLKEPEPTGLIQKVGDSNIILTFYGWVDQSQTAFGKARGIAIARVKAALEDGGFSLPEPIYRLRVDGAVSTGLTVSETTPDTPAEHPRQPEHKDISTAEAEDVTPDRHLDEKVTEERAEQGEKDLLDQSRPVE